MRQQHLQSHIFVGRSRRCRPGHGLYVHREGVVPVASPRKPSPSSGGAAITRGDVVIEDSTEDEDGDEGSEDDGDDDDQVTESTESSSAGVREELLLELTRLEARNRQLRNSARELRSAHAR